MTVSEVRIGCSESVREKLHEIKGPQRTYDATLERLIEIYEQQDNEEI
jgi:hypothetical protein